MSLIQVDKDKCLRDGLCVEVCPVGILAMDEESGVYAVPQLVKHCIGCGHCVAVCPEGALDNVRASLKDQIPLTRYPVLDGATALTFLRSRRSIRCYRPEPVPRDLVLQLFQAARYAPSGHNSQGLSYLVVDKREDIDRLIGIVVEWMRERVEREDPLARKLGLNGIIKAHERGEDKIFRGAPLVLVAHASGDSWAAPVSTVLALEYVELYATALGLGTCWAGFAHACGQEYPQFAEFLNLPGNRVITGIMMAGYPRHTFRRLPERNPLDVAWLQR